MNFQKKPGEIFDSYLRSCLRFVKKQHIVMIKYSVKQLAELAGVSIKTLHYYDQIGLLKPANRTNKGYRSYGRGELLKLQQILFYRMIDMPLKEIQEIVNNPNFDLLKALKFHKKKLSERHDRTKTLLATIDKTILELKNNHMKMTDQELYAGFDPEQIKPMRNEVKERWGEEQLTEVEDRIQKMGKEGWEDAQKKGEEINQLLADLMDLPASHPKVQEAIALHHRQLNLFYEVDKERYIGLATMYVEDERFNAHYEKYRPRLASFLKESIEIYCQNHFKA